MNFRILPVVLGFVALLSSPAGAAPKAKEGVLPFKGSYTGTFVVTTIPLGGVVAKGAGKVTVVPTNGGRGAVLRIRGPFATKGSHFVFGATFRLLPNNTSQVSDCLLGIVPGHALPSAGLYQIKSPRQISVTEAIKSGEISNVSTGTVRIAKTAGNKQRLIAVLSVASFGPTTVPIAYKLRFTVVGNAPKL